MYIPIIWYTCRETFNFFLELLPRKLLFYVALLSEPVYTLHGKLQAVAGVHI